MIISRISNFCIIAILITLMIPTKSISLERDYSYTGGYVYGDNDRDVYDTDEDDTNIYLYDSDELCCWCFSDACRWQCPWNEYNDINVNSIPASGGQYNDFECSACAQNKKIYAGYFQYRYKGDHPFLRRQIEYTNKYPNYQTYWPETSEMAAKINNIAMLQFSNLIDSTALRRVPGKTALMDDFIVDSWYFDDLRNSLPCALCGSCFRFSDYFRVCTDLKSFSKTHFSESESTLLETKIDTILDALCPLFLEMYSESLQNHPTQEIQDEVIFIEYIYQTLKNATPTGRLKIFKKNSDLFFSNFRTDKISLSGKAKIQLFEKNTACYLQSNMGASTQPDWFLSEFLLWKGSSCNDCFLYSDAIETLTLAININPNNPETYKERALAYFEQDKLDLAIEDMRKAKQNEKTNPPYLKNIYLSNRATTDVDPPLKKYLAYSTGFLLGVSEGGEESLIEFIPNTLSCITGILHGLWAAACSPNEVSREIIEASYELLSFLQSHTALECMQTAVPELKELCSNWEKLSEFEKGKKTGFIIGKYGVDVLAPSATIGSINKFRQLKRANTIFTLECCAQSAERQAYIQQRSFRHVQVRSRVVNAAKEGTIIAHNPNVATHIMQEKHCWNKIINISGNTIDDFKSVCLFLEKNGILKGNAKHIGSFPAGLNKPKINRWRYSMTVMGETVEADFVEYIETHELYLNDAWVKTR